MSRLLAPGGWVRSSSIAGDSSGTRCEFCGSFIDTRGGWVHVALNAFVCSHCLPDPEVGGPDASARVREEHEREVKEAWPF